MKRILITSINGRFDELLIEYFISQQYNVRILAEYVDPGYAWLKLPVEIYCCSPYDNEQLAYAAKGCDFVIATHCNALPPSNKKTGIHSSPITQLFKQDLSRLNTVIYLKEGKDLAVGYSLNRRKCIKRTISMLNHSAPGSQKGRNKNVVRSVYVDASNVISFFENGKPENGCFELLADRIHEIIKNGGQNEKWVIGLNQEEANKSWMDIARNWIETWVNRFFHLAGSLHKFTGQ